MSASTTALQIYCALISRDPLAQQRFTELGERFAQLAHLAQAAAIQFESVEHIWRNDPERAIAAAAQRWDVRSVPLMPKAVKEPANKIGSEEIGVLPLSQGDLLGEMRQ